jgi:hypothetical protein
MNGISERKKGGGGAKDKDTKEIKHQLISMGCFTNKN